MTRNNLLETLGEDYIRTARAKGLTERQVIFKHGLRASLTPIVTMFGLDIALLVGGAVITESVFNIQGLGYLAINGATTQDLPTVLGVVLLAAVAVALMNLSSTSSTHSSIRESVRMTSPRGERLLDVRGLTVRFPPPTASSRQSPTSRSRCRAARRSASSASPARERASRTSRSWACLNRRAP